MRKIGIVCGDAHGNSTAGLCKPVINLDDAGTYHANRFQRELWKFWNDDIDYCKRLAGDDEIFAIIGGDMAEGDAKDRSTQLITRNPKTILDIACDNLEPLAQVAKAMYFLRGTAAHVGKSAALDEQIAANFDNTVKASKNIASRWELRLNIDGYKIYASHHPPAMTNPVNAAKKLRDKFLSYGENPPDLGIFFHIHHINDSGLTIKPRVISAPCWQVHTEHIHRIPVMQAPQIGILILEIVDGKLVRLEPRLHQFKMVHEERA